MYVLHNLQRQFSGYQFFIANLKASNDLFPLISLIFFESKKEILSAPLYTEFIVTSGSWRKLRFDIALGWSSFENIIGDVPFETLNISASRNSKFRLRTEIGQTYLSNSAKLKSLTLYIIRKYFEGIPFILLFRALL